MPFLDDVIEPRADERLALGVFVLVKAGVLRPKTYHLPNYPNQRVGDIHLRCNARGRWVQWHSGLVLCTICKKRRRSFDP